jgi:heme/copper-type cytochrome/quinol oxidase subunit 2
MAWYNLFTTDYGLMSLAVIVVVIGIGVYFARKFNELSKQKPGEDKGW